MASNRKKKKAVKAAEKANGKPNTSVGDAINRAKAKPKVKPKPDLKIIKGFGSKTKGAVIHAVTSINNAALCDTKIADIEIKDYLIPKDVTCKKCQRYTAFKLAFELHAKDDKKPTKKAEVKTKTKKPEVKTKKQTVVKEEKPDVESQPEEEVDSTMENLKGLMSFKLKKMEKRIIKKLEKYCETILDARPMFFIVRKANNMYEVIHDASRYVICDNVKESDAEALLTKYLEISPRWDGQTKPSKEWLSALRKIHEKYFPKKTVAKAKSRTLKRRKPRPSIKRRKDSKQEKRVIKRRSK